MALLFPVLAIMVGEKFMSIFFDSQCHEIHITAFATVLPLLDKMIVVKEEWIALAILRLVELEKCVVEGAGATGLAAILAGQLNEFKGKKFVSKIFLNPLSTDFYIQGRSLTLRWQHRHYHIRSLFGTWFGC